MILVVRAAGQETIRDGRIGRARRRRVSLVPRASHSAVHRSERPASSVETPRDDRPIQVTTSTAGGLLVASTGTFKYSNTC